jgi:hypothetical protein
MRQTQRSRSQGLLQVIDPDEEQVAAQTGGEALVVARTAEGTGCRSIWINSRRPLKLPHYVLQDLGIC